ncbi:MAG TPA: TetR/AcrR family transcriptional regulator [Acetobacteraceae bacterium]|jgi:TetR/AcrR family transcriptional repressor of mexJK operon|nr:TetR/AcrR family transcriptional regulator [Acetobacteraceae bacterium]
MTIALDSQSTTTDSSPKRRQMIEASAELFMAHGYEKVSMDAVARAAGVSKATLYAHFTSKDMLFASIVGEACQRNTALESSFPAEVSDIRAALVTIGTRVLTFLMRPHTQAIYRVAVAESSRFPELGRAFMANGPQRFLDRFSVWLAEQTAAGHLAVPDPLIAADQFAALLRVSLFMRATLGLADDHSEADIAATVAAAVDTFMKAFGPTASRA